MGWSQEFFRGQRRLTSQLKHSILRDYVKEFAYHLGSARPMVYYVDGFAGAGAYGEDGEAGSPLLIARLARDLRTAPKPVVLKCINVEEHPGRYASLVEATRGYTPDIVERNINSTLIEAIPEILRLIGPAAAFFFIDPFGTKGIAFSQLQPILRRTDRTEVLINLHTDGIAKKAGWLNKLGAPRERDRNLAQKLTQNVANALDMPLDRLDKVWKEAVAHGGTFEFEERVKTYYLKLLRQKTAFRRAAAFRILYRPEDRNSPVCFHLVFGTTMDIGLLKMNNAVAKAHEALYAESYRGTLFSDVLLEMDREHGRKQVRREILSNFAGREFTIEQARVHCISETDCVLMAGEYNKVIRDMRAEGLVERIGSGRISTATKYRVSQAAEAIGS